MDDSKNNKIHLVDVNVRAKYLLKFYNRVAGQSKESISEMPVEVLDLLSKIKYPELVRPFVLEMKQKGMGRESIAQRLNITVPEAQERLKQ